MVTHGSIIAMEVSSTAAAAAAATSLSWGKVRRSAISILVLGLSLLDVDTSAVDLRDRAVLDEVLSDLLVGKCDKAEPSRRTRVNIFQNYRIMHLAELLEVLLQLLTCQFEVEATHEDLALGVGELDTVLGVITRTHGFLLHDGDVGVWLLDLLPTVRHHEIVVLVAAMVVTAAAATHVTASITPTLVVICRLHVDSLLKDEVTLDLVLVDDLSLNLLRFILIVEAEEDKAEPAASLSQLLTHHNRILDLAEGLEVVQEMVLRGREG